MNNRSAVFLIWGLGGILFASHAFAEGEQWLRYNYSRDADEAGRVSHSLKMSPDRPSGVVFPEFKDPQPMFAVWKSPMAKGGQVNIAFDSDGKPGAYNLLYVDSDCDGNLKEETPYKPFRSDSYYAYYGPVKIILDGEDGPVTYHLNFTHQKYNTSAVYLSVMSVCWYEGMITVGGEKKLCVLTDATNNGQFNDTSKEYYGADRIVIGEGAKAQTTIVGKFLQLDGKFYRLEVARDGAYVKILPAGDVALGRIKVPPEINELYATGENGYFRVSPSEDLDSVPAGSYRIYRWVINRTDEKQNKWTMSGQGFRESGDFTVNKGGTAYLAVGEPITSKMEVKTKRGKYAFSHNLTGQMGESITLIKDNQRMPAPKLRITSADKTFNKSYSFEYG
jgi:hypothetical protein